MSYTGSKAQPGNGATVSIGSSPVLVGEVSDFTQSGTTNKSEDATNLESTAVETIPTILDPGSFSGVMNRVSGDAGQIAVRAAFTATPPTVVQWTVQLPKTATQTTAGDKYVFNGWVEEFLDVTSLAPTKLVKTQFKVRITGSVAYTQGS